MSKKPVVLMVLDGYGLNDRTEGNAIALANTPVMDKLMKECPFVKGQASGLAVGLPDGQMGNSEVGHMNIGAGRIIYQDLTRITKAIEDGDFFENKALLAAMDNCKKNDSDLHLWGLLSDGGVHSHITHLYGLLEMAKKQGLSKVYVHAFLDGRDTPPASGKEFIEELEKKMKEIGVGKIASLSGRYYAMDRDNNWDRVQKAYDSLTKGEGVQAEDAVKAMEDSYAKDVTDEFVLPTVITENGKPVSVVKENDSVIFFNFRPDRAREMTRAFCDDKFTGFDRPFIKTTFVCFKDYDETIPNKLIAFEKEHIVNTFGEYLAKCGKTQLRLAETEKYAHVTFFFNGGVEEPNVDEARLLVNSPKDVATYDLKPEMSAPEVGMDLVEAIKSDKYDVIVINFANPDMVGHTGVIPAVIKAVERIDACVGAAVEAVKKVDGVKWVLGLDSIVGPNLPDSLIPDKIKTMLKTDNYELQFVCSDYASATDESNAQIHSIDKIVKSYDKTGMVIGEAPLMKDLQDVTDVDLVNVNIISIAAIFVIILIIFKSISLPVILVAVIEFAIMINMAIPYYQGISLPFVASIVIGAIQLGATVDYAILMTTRFRDELQSGKSAKEAALTAATMSDASIISSALVLFCATLGVGLVSRIEIISGICMMLARGSLISACVILFLLPAILAAFEPIIAKTTLHWRKPKVKKSRADRASAQ